MNPDESNLPGVEFADAAVGIANSLEAGARNEIMTAAANTYSALGLIDDALKCADEISDSFTRDTAISQIAVNAVAAAPDTDPLSLIESIDDLGSQALAVEEIAVKYAEQNLFEDAVEVCGQLVDRDSALARIAKIMGKADSLERSAELAREIEDPNLRTMCLIELARSAGDRQLVEQAEHLLVAAEAEAGVESQFIEQRVYQLINIGDAYKALMQRERVKEILSRAQQLCDEIEGDGGDMGKTFARDAALADVAGGFVRSRYYAEADLATEQIGNPFKFAQASIEQVIARHEDGQDEQALTMLAEARELITAEPCKSEFGLIVRDYSYSQLAVAYAALRDFKSALSAARLVCKHEAQQITMLELGWKAAEAGLTDSLFEVQDAMSGDYSRVTYLVSICDALVKKGNKELIPKLLLRAIADCEKFSRPDQRCLMLIKITSGLIACDLGSKATELFSEALHTAIKIEDRHQQAQILAALAEQYREHARPVNAEEKQLLEELPT